MIRVEPTVKEILVLLLFLFPVTVRSQPKGILKPVTPEEYDKWYSLENSGISKAGSWLSYSMYNTESDTLVIRQVHGTKKYVLPKAGPVKFLGDSLAAFNQDGRCFLLFLNTGQQEVFEPGTGLAINDDEQYLVIFRKAAHRLVLRSLQKNDSLALTGVATYFYNPAFEGICTLSSGEGSYRIDVIRLRKGFPEKRVPVPQNREVLELQWHPGGKSLAFTMGPPLNARDTPDAGLVGYYDISREKVRYLNPAETKVFPGDHILITHWNYSLEFSPDGQCIFFAHKPKEPATDTGIPEIWKSDDPYLKKRMPVWSHNLPEISMWNPDSNRYLQVTDPDFPEAFYGLSSDYALVYNPARYRLYNSTLADTADVYLMNLKDGRRTLLISRFINAPGSLNISPSGRYILWLKAEQWWCYDTQKARFGSLDGKFTMIDGTDREGEPVNPVPEGWTPDEKAVYLSGQYDLWKVSMDGAPPERITRGLENGACFRLINAIVGLPLT